MKKLSIILAGLLVSTGISAQELNVPTAIDEQKDTVSADTVMQSASVPSPSAVALTPKALGYIRNVYDKTVYAQNIVSGIDLSLSGMGKNISLSGKLQMRRDQVIRICVHAPFIGTEIARLEFTPSYVLLLDRWHGKYVKSSYDDVSFLKSEGLSFYTLQSLFWNELFQPGKKNLSEKDLSGFTADLNAPCIRYQTSDTKYRWNTDKNNQITYSGMTYGYNTSKPSNVMVNYGDYTSLGVKLFPKKLYITFDSKAVSTGILSLNISMDKISTEAGWNPQTDVPSKYVQVSVEEFLQQMTSF